MQRQQWGLQWEKYRRHYGAGSSLPSAINERKRPVRAHKRDREGGKKKRHNNQQRINGRDGGKERGGEAERETNAQREGLRSRPIRKGGDGGRKELKGALMRDADRAPAN